MREPFSDQGGDPGNRNELLDTLEVRRLALVTPYIGAVQQRIIDVYASAGLECVDERHFDERVNYAFAELDDRCIADAVRRVSTARPEAVVIMCTNLRSAHLVDALETELRIPILDSVAAFVWKAARLCGIDTRVITGWGRLFSLAGSPETPPTGGFALCLDPSIPYPPRP